MILREAAQLALDALRLSDPKPRPGDDDYAEHGWEEHNAAVYALRAALAEDVPETNFGNRVQVAVSKMETVEPVAWITPGQELHLVNFEGFEDWAPLYIAPPKRTPLTDEHLTALCRQHWDRQANVLDHIAYARAIERAHGIGGEE